MIGVKVGPVSRPVLNRLPEPPADLGWTGPALALSAQGAGWRSGINPRALVDPAIWTGAAIHVDGVLGDDARTGLGAADGDFSQAKRTIHSAFTAGNATGAPYRVIVLSGDYALHAFTNNGTVEPSRSCAIIGWNGPLRYRTASWTHAWTLDQGTTYRIALSHTVRMFRTDVLTEEGLYTELTHVADPATCRATLETWHKAAANVLYVNIGKAPTVTDLAPIRAHQGLRLLNHVGDLYLENVHCEGGITGGLHCDAAATRTIVGVNCSFRYPAPWITGPVPLDAVQIRRVNGLVAFFDCDASAGARDGWNFREDGNPQMQVLLVNCTSHRNGTPGSPTSGGLVTRNGVRSVVIGGSFGSSRSLAEVQHFDTAQSWMLGSAITARSGLSVATAARVTGAARLWLDRTTADAAGSAENWAIEAEGGRVFTRGHRDAAGLRRVAAGGAITPY
jgi:hypothetical protein